MMRVLVCLLILVLILVLSSVMLRAFAGAAAVYGGAFVRRPAIKRKLANQNLVVDTLNLTHYLIKTKQIPQSDNMRCSIVDAIEFAADQLRPRFSGRIYFVVKDRDSRAQTIAKDLAEGASRKEALADDAVAHAIFQSCARRNRVFISAVENYQPRLGSKFEPNSRRRVSHSALGRDDFYAGKLAWSLKCRVLTEDRMRDFGELRRAVAPFVVREFSPFRQGPPTQEVVNPAALAYREIKAPMRIGFAEAGL